MSPQDRSLDFASAGETKGMELTYPPEGGELSSTQAVQLHITVEKTVQYDTDDGESGPSPGGLPTLGSRHA